MVRADPTIPVERFRGIARNLLSQTQAGRVNWTRKAGHETSYGLSLPESQVILTYHRPAVEPDYITLEVLNPDGVSAGVLAADEPDEQDPEPNPDWPLLRSIYTEAHRLVTGWDRTLSDVEKALAGSGPIGAPVRPAGGSLKFHTVGGP